jgi:molybdate-binding protein
VLACPSVAKGRLQPLYSSFQGISGVRRLEKDIAGCHMTGADEGPGLGFAGRVHEAL